MKNPMDQAIEFVDGLTHEKVRVYARVTPTLHSIKSYKARCHLEALVQAVCQDRVGRSITP